MPIRFRRTLRIAPGVKINFSKSGMSTTVGPKGFHFTFGKRGIRRTVGIPGTGISEVDYIKKNETPAEKEKKEEAEERREERAEESREGKRETRGETAEPVRAARHSRRTAPTSGGSTALRNVFVLLGVVIFFFIGASMLGLIPAHFLANSLQYITHLVRSTGLRNFFILLAFVVFFCVGAAVLGLIPAHFFSNTLQFVTRLVQSTGH